mgnify:CR=1 FL=1
MRHSGDYCKRYFKNILFGFLCGSSKIFLIVLVRSRGCTDLEPNDIRFLRALIAWLKQRQTFVRIREQISKNRRHGKPENCHKLCRSFRPALKVRRTCFIFYKSIIFRFKNDFRVSWNYKNLLTNMVCTC